MTDQDWKGKRNSASSLIRQAQEWYNGHILREAAHAKAE
jgi:hypothetical protein